MSCTAPSAFNAQPPVFRSGEKFGKPSLLCGLPLAVLVVFAIGLNAHAASLSDKVMADTELPAYLNRDTAVLVLERNDADTEISLTLSFSDRDSGLTPAAPMKVTLAGPALRQKVAVPIAKWPDGEYVVRIAEADAPTGSDDVLIRGIRKQTRPALVAPNGPIDVRALNMLMLDDWYFEEEAGVQRTIQPAELIAIEPWRTYPELKSPVATLLDFRFADDGYFYARLSGGCKADAYWVRTEDMKRWKKIEEPAPRSAHCLLTIREPQASHPPINPEGRFRRYDPKADGPVDISQVQVLYTGLTTNVKWGDIPVPHRSRLAVWMKPNGEHLILGDAITRDRAPRDNEIGRWQDTNDNFGNPRLTADGKQLRAFQSRRIPRHDPFRVHYDNLKSERIMVTWATADGLHWKPTYFDVPTPQDPRSTEHYYVDLWWEENRALELAYLLVFDVQIQRLYTELAYSRDGFTWRRFEGSKPFLDNGNVGEWNFGYSRTSGNRDRLEWKGKYYEPMQGVNVPHFMKLLHGQKVTPEFCAKRFGGRNGIEETPIMAWYGSWEEIAKGIREQVSSPGVMRYRKDGWVALSPMKRRGALTTKVLRGASGLSINARTLGDGFVRVAVLDANGNPLDAYSGSNAACFTGDSVAAPLRWSKGAVAELPKTEFKLFITIEKGDIYALQF